MIVFILYQCVQVVVLPFIGIYLLIRKIKGKSVFGDVRERIGLIPEVSASKQSIWIHAVSVGEILAIERLIMHIKQEVPGVVCYVTTGTVSGKKMAQEQLSADYVSFLPFDFLIPMFMAFKRIKPKALIIIEAEIWPNFLMIATLQKVPLYLLNARFNESTFKKLPGVRFFLSKMYQQFDCIFAQSDQDKQLFEGLKVPSKNISVLGNIKAYNVEPKKNAALRSFSMAPEKLKQLSPYFVLLVGSVHPGELEVYLNLFKELKPEFKQLKMILAPRHFNWHKELCEKVKATGYEALVWDDEATSLNTTNDPLGHIIQYVFKDYDILLTCKIGKLFNLYPLADIFYLGGTFVPVGGHNLLEPAVWGNPIIIGPFHQNCKDNADQLERHNALIKVATSQEVVEKTRLLLHDQRLRETMARNAATWLVHEAIVVTHNIKKVFENLKK